MKKRMSDFAGRREPHISGNFSLATTTSLPPAFIFLLHTQKKTLKRPSVPGLTYALRCAWLSECSLDIIVLVTVLVRRCTITKPQDHDAIWDTLW
ncbi:hypothetical protein CPC08DRAFT_164385 [Agrocybe pediades]|nr:hypothetical protein CPC08DRAFT_164385 [Agrocybe pediades]